MTIDPKAAELAKALADAVAEQSTAEYQAMWAAEQEKAQIDAVAEEAQAELEAYIRKEPRLAGVNRTPAQMLSPKAESEDETATAKPNGGYLD